MSRYTPAAIIASTFPFNPNSSQGVMFRDNCLGVPNDEPVPAFKVSLLVNTSGKARGGKFYRVGVEPWQSGGHCLLSALLFCTVPAFRNKNETSPELRQSLIAAAKAWFSHKDPSLAAHLASDNCAFDVIPLLGRAANLDIIILRNVGGQVVYSEPQSYRKSSSKMQVYIYHGGEFVEPVIRQHSAPNEKTLNAFTVSSVYDFK
eukprot:gnl/Hemi2/21224_TR7040_c0_g1_i1.p1 gnl/Hemi2/21224_TR7040_c0_g1~~gnl/Hemi2/21224_TR7040_c0_g1_i1.p1  ORF type:complete len:219 (+),score=6.24 gnl/Hemi2/21224_TR7040_c0_g1_i1:46-657(+)